jgi:hypothetical protein
METRRVPAAMWRTTFDDLSRSFAGAVASLEIVGGGLGAEEDVREQPLLGISSDRSGITVQFEKKGGIRFEHRVAEPTMVRIVTSNEGAVVAVEIEDRSGIENLVRFRSPARPEALDRGSE